MNEQSILLIFLLLGLGVTIALYVFKAAKQLKYKGDERWQMIQVKANNIANLSNWILILILAILPIFIDPYATFTLQRVITFGLIYIGIRNFIELAATFYFDKQL